MESHGSSLFGHFISHQRVKIGHNLTYVHAHASYGPYVNFRFVMWRRPYEYFIYPIMIWNISQWISKTFIIWRFWVCEITISSRFQIQLNHFRKFTSFIYRLGQKMLLSYIYFTFRGICSACYRQNLDASKIISLARSVF